VANWVRKLFSSTRAASGDMAVIGGGWAGCSAAVELAAAGHKVTLFEASRTLGGRARRVVAGGRALDNGQHILLGAYESTLRLLQQVGIDHRQAFLRLPLQMRYPPDSGGMDFVAPRLPAPLHLVGALLGSTGLTRSDKMALARFSSTARWMRWQLDVDCSVAQLLERWDQSPRLNALMWHPLCLAALNTPPERASAKIFLNVLRDSLGAGRAASDMLIPKVDLSALFPVSAARFITDHGGFVHTGSAVSRLQQTGDGRWNVGAGAADGNAFDGIVLATGCRQAAKLLASIAPATQRQDQTETLKQGQDQGRDQDGHPGVNCVATSIAQLDALTMEAITTCYLQYDSSVRLDLAFFALQDAPALGRWGQFVFDRGHLDGASSGLLAVVISASGACASLDQAQLAAAIGHQLAQAFRRPELAAPHWVQVISEKRATFASAPDLARPSNATEWPTLCLAGDYTASDYPATLESAIRSGVKAAAALMNKR
jgi:squalene-associated FAD-dependent desaturase